MEAGMRIIQRFETRRQNSTALDVCSSENVDCDTDHYLVVSKLGRD
jgi:hypothetical protein